MKKLLYILGGLLALVVIGLIVVLLSLGRIVKSGVNKYGPGITKTTVVLNSADISPFSGKGSLKELTIGNPKGWQAERAFFLKEISIDLVPKSVTTDHIVINSIVIDNPEITYETTGTLSTSNIQDLIKNIQGEGTQAAQPEQQKKTAEGQPEKKIEIKSFRLTNVTVKAIYNTNTYTVTIPDLIMTDLGTKEGGLTPNQLAVAVLKEVSTQVGEAALKQAAKSSLKNKAIDSIKGLFGK